MKIYFAGSIRGGRDDVELYEKIISELQSHGVVLTEHVGNPQLTAAGENLDSRRIYERDMAWLREADVFVAEATTPSVGVGYEIAQAERMKKPILCLFRDGAGRNLSVMLAANKQLNTAHYKSFNEIPQILKNFFSQREM